MDDIKDLIGMVNNTYAEGLKQGHKQARSIDRMSLDEILGYVVGKFSKQEISDTFKALNLKPYLKKG